MRNEENEIAASMLHCSVVDSQSEPTVVVKSCFTLIKINSWG